MERVTVTVLPPRSSEPTSPGVLQTSRKPFDILHDLRENRKMFYLISMALTAVGVPLAIVAWRLLRPRDPRPPGAREGAGMTISGGGDVTSARTTGARQAADPGAGGGAPRVREGTSVLGLGVGLAAAALLLAAWVLLARGVLRSGSLATLDHNVTVELRRNAKPWLTRAMQGLTWLGSLAVVLPLAAVSCALLFTRARRRFDAVLLGTVTLGAVILNAIVKMVVARPRPEVVAPLVDRPETFSFPSGHAATATAFYLTLALLVTEGAGWTRARRAGAIGAALVVAGVVGFSRIYLGVHYFSDVVAGIARGALWMVVCVMGFTLFQRGWPRRRRRG